MIKSLTPSPATASGLLALGVGTAALVAGTVTDANADVLVYTSGLTTSLAPDGTASNNDVFFDFLAGTSSKNAASPYQYQLNTTADGARIYPSGGGNDVAGNPICGATRYTAGELIGSGSSYGPTGIFISVDNNGSNEGSFGPGDSGYLGFRLTQSLDTFYGFADITLQNNRTVTLNSFGYETTPGAAIAAGAAAVPEANPLELLLLGAVGIGAYRAAQNRRPKAA